MHFLTKATLLVPLFTVGVVVSSAGQAHAEAGVPTRTSNNVMNDLYDDAASDGAYDLIVRVDDALNNLTYTVHNYVDQTWDDETGRYRVDCSGYVGRMLDDAVPAAYDELRDWAGTSRPRSSDYYRFFKSISIGGTKGRWRRPEKVAYLSPGDVLVWKYLVDPGTGSTGHTLIIVGNAVKDSTRGSNIYRVRVSDSANSGHSNDNRGASGSGVGAGEILLKVDSNGQPIEYTWSLTGPWHADIAIAMGRARY